MIFTSKKPSSSDLSEPFADFLKWDTVAHMKEAFSLMGRRFIGQPKKAQIANGIARYVREHPLDVLHKCESDTLMYIKKMIEMGKGSCITIGEPNIYNLQIQEMELVLTYYDKTNNSTEFYLLDELHDIFAPHIDEAYKNPSEVLQQDMVKHLQMMSDEIKSAADPEAKMKEFLTEAMMYQLHMGVNDIRTALTNQLNRKFPGEMSEKELNVLSSTLEQQSKELARMLKELEDSAKDCPNMTTSRDGSLSLEQLYRDAEDAKKLIEFMQKMVGRTKRSKTDFEGVMKEIMAELPDDLDEEDIKYDN